MFYPTASIYGIFNIFTYCGTIFYHYKQPNVGKYTLLEVLLAPPFTLVFQILQSYLLRIGVWNPLKRLNAEPQEVFGAPFTPILIRYLED